MNDGSNVSRDELYSLVWSLPVDKVAQKLGVSGSYLARVCFALNVPRPPRGYWAKLAVGQTPPRPLLPLPNAGFPESWIRIGASRSGLTQFYRHPSRITRIGADARTVGRQLVAKTALCLRAAARNSNQEATYILPPIRRPLVFDIVTTAQGLEKCINLACQLVNELERRSYRIAVAGAAEKFSRMPIGTMNTAAIATGPAEEQKVWPPRPTIIYIKSIPIGIAIVEMTQSTKVRYDGHSRYVPLSKWKGPATGYSWTTTKPLPTGLIKLVAYSPYVRKPWHQQWSEKKSGDLCRQIRMIVADLEEAAVKLAAP